MSRRCRGIAPVKLLLRVLKKHLFSDLANNVTGQDMALLNSRSFLRRNAKRTIRNFLHRPTRRTGERHGKNPLRLCNFQRPHNVSRVTAGRDTDCDISFFAERFHLTRKHQVESVIVTDCGDSRRVPMQRERRQRTSLLQVASGKLRGEMLRIGCATSITAKKDLATGSERLYDLKRRSRHQLAKNNIL